MNRAVILAAGYGSRLSEVAPDLPKPLVPVRNKALIVHIIERLRSVGIREIGVIVGYRGELLREALAAEQEVVFFDNDEYDKPNGTSLLKAASFVQGPTMLVMSDHLWSPTLGQKLVDSTAPASDAVLAIDRDIEGCFDIPDATKVQLDKESRICAIHKELESYDALDTGVFRIVPALIEALQQAEGPQGCSLSDGVRQLASLGRMWTCDVTGESWLDVDTPEALAFAESPASAKLWP